MKNTQGVKLGKMTISAKQYEEAENEKLNKYFKN